MAGESELAELARFLQGVEHVDGEKLLGQLDMLGIMEPQDLGASCTVRSGWWWWWWWHA